MPFCVCVCASDLFGEEIFIAILSDCCSKLNPRFQVVIPRCLHHHELETVPFETFAYFLIFEFCFYPIRLRESPIQSDRHVIVVNLFNETICSIIDLSIKLSHSSIHLPLRVRPYRAIALKSDESL